MPRVKFDLNLLPSSPNLDFEAALWLKRYWRIAGIDEAGRGALAGPVAAAAVVLPCHWEVAAALHGVRDSKQMTAQEREYWAELIRQNALSWAVGFASNEEIDALGIVPATRLAGMRALDGLDVEPDHLLIDFLNLPEVTLPQTSLVKGDQRSLSIAAASVLAKTARDEWMGRLDNEYQGYAFAAHKGYATLEHRRRLAQLGPCPVHRRTFHCPEIK